MAILKIRQAVTIGALIGIGAAAPAIAWFVNDSSMSALPNTKAPSRNRWVQSTVEPHLLRASPDTHSGKELTATPRLELEEIFIVEGPRRRASQTRQQRPLICNWQQLQTFAKGRVRVCSRTSATASEAPGALFVPLPKPRQVVAH